MALPATCIHEIQTGGSDTANGGHFDPSNANMATDLAATNANTSSPVVTSASYTFVAGDVGAWLFVKAGTNWTPGWYQIASVAGGAATLNAAIGAAVLVADFTANTVAGCATVASPTGGTWAVDYSQGTSPISLTGLTSSAANAIILTASATVAMIGNGIFVTGGTNATTGVYNISNASAGVSLTVDRNWGTAAVAAGTAGVGGCFASPGFVFGIYTSKNRIFQKSGTYTCTSSTGNVSNGVCTGTNGATFTWEGYNSLRGDMGTSPVITLGALTSATLLNFTNATALIRNLVFDGNNGTSNKVWSMFGSGNFFEACVFRNCPGSGANFACQIATGCYFYKISTGNSAGIVPGSTCNFEFCVFDTIGQATNPALSSNGILSIFKSIFLNCPGDALQIVNAAITINMVAVSIYNPGRDGVNVTTTMTTGAINMSRVIVTKAARRGFTVGSQLNTRLSNCAGWSNTSGNNDASGDTRVLNFLSLTGDPFTNAAGGDFSLNNTAGAGASCRGVVRAFSGISTNAYDDLGGVQHQDAGGGVTPNYGIRTGGRI